MQPSRLHITGASGAGTTTLGAALAETFGCPHHDADDFYWLPSDSPYREERSRQKHEAWLAQLQCPVIRLDGQRPLGRLVADVLEGIAG